MKHHDGKIALQPDETCINMCTVDIFGQEAVLHCFGLGCPNKIQRMMKSIKLCLLAVGMDMPQKKQKPKTP